MIVCLQAAQTHSKLVASMSGGDSVSSVSQKGTGRKSGGRKQRVVKGRDRYVDDDSQSQWKLQFMDIGEV